MTSPAAIDIENFFAGGVTAAKFPDGQYGHVIGGEIIAEPRMQQQRDYTSGEPLVYQDGNPQMQMIVVVQAHPGGNFHEDGTEDDGQRAFYIKGQMKQAVAEALRKTGARSPQRGGKLWIKYVEDKPTTLKNGRPGNPQKIYVAKYEPPAQAAAAAFFPAGDPPAAAATELTADDMRTRSGATNPPASIPPCPPGFDPATWARLDNSQREQMAAALGTRAAALAGRFTDEPPF